MAIPLEAPAARSATTTPWSSFAVACDVNPGTVSFVKRLPNFCVRSAEKAEFSNPTSITPTLTLDPVSVVFELLCGLSLLYERVESFHVNPEVVFVTVGLFVTGAGLVGCVAGVVGVVGVAADVEPPPPPPPPPQLINKAANPIRMELFLKLCFLEPFLISFFNWFKLVVIKTALLSILWYCCYLLYINLFFKIINVKIWISFVILKLNYIYIWYL